MEIRTDIQIDASAERVWAALTDFHAYPEWNPFLRSIEGRAVPGQRIVLVMQQSPTRVWTLHPRILRADAPRELRWLAEFWVPGLLDMEHVFEIESLGETSVRFVQRARFVGVGVPFFRWTTGPRTLDGFEAMNEALKERVEAG
jgi:hypothetical protein